jgi:astacin
MSLALAAAASVWMVAGNAPEMACTDGGCPASARGNALLMKPPKIEKVSVDMAEPPQNAGLAEVHTIIGPVELVESTNNRISRITDQMTDPNGGAVAAGAGREVSDEDVKTFTNILKTAAKIQKQIPDRVGDAPSADASTALRDLERDEAAGTDASKDVQGKDKEAIRRAIDELSKTESPETAEKKGELITSKILQDLNNEGDTPEQATNVEEGSTVFQGDMVAENNSQLLLFQRNAGRGERWSGTLWPEGKLKYCLHSSAETPEHINAMNEAREHIESATNGCITVEQVAKSASSDTCVEPGAIVTDGGGCSSYVGKVSVQGGGHVTLHRYGCTSLGVAVHELLHALGQSHEQSRPDRDTYVQIQWQNINSGTEHNFDKRDTADAAIDYDYTSLMHYGSTDFGKQGRTTIQVLQEGHTIGNRQGLSAADKDQLSRMYCGGSTGTSPPRRRRAATSPPRRRRAPVPAPPPSGCPVYPSCQLESGCGCDVQYTAMKGHTTTGDWCYFCYMW